MMPASCTRDAASLAVPSRYELGPFNLDSGAGILIRQGIPEPLGMRAVALLTALVSQAGRLVSKQALLETVWPGVVVEEGNLSVQISAIRRVLAQVEGGEQWVETHARRGYRFVGPVVAHAVAVSTESAEPAATLNFPKPLTSFVGRTRDLAILHALLPQKRLLSLVGTGGIGKTRLALRIGTDVAEHYREGAWFVDLAPLTDPTRVLGSIASALGVRDAPGTALIDALCARLRRQALLLILDNCEQVADECARVVEVLLSRTSLLTIMVTGREPLGVPGEQVYSLTPLSLPGAVQAVASVRKSEAVQLFIQRAQSWLSDFDITPDNAAALAQLCTHLDGLPLAIELAAARIQALSIEEINARLDDRFRLLAMGSRTAQPRQQTLRATFDWSHELLSERERTVLRRLAMFRGGFTLKAATSVAADSDIDAFAVTDLLSRLVARSLVVVEAGRAGTRYRQLETLQAYGTEKLRHAGEEATIRRRHATYYADLLVPAPNDWLHMSDRAWQALYFPEYDNLRSALDWAFGATGDRQLGIRLASASGPIWQEMSLLAAGRHWLTTAIKHIETDTPLEQQARLWQWLGMLIGDSSPPETTDAMFRAAAIYRRLPNPLQLGFVLANSTFHLVVVGDFGAAEQALDEAFPLLDRAGVAKAMARWHESWAFLKARTNRLIEARDGLEKTLDLYRKSGAEREAERMETNLGDHLWSLGELDAAADRLRGAISFGGRDRKQSFAMNLCCLCGVLTELGRLNEALAAAREGLPLLNAVGCAWIHADHMASLAGRAGRLKAMALLAGYADASHAARNAQRGPNETRAREYVRVLLERQFGEQELERLLDEGTALSDDEATILALEGTCATQSFRAPAPVPPMPHHRRSSA